MTDAEMRGENEEQMKVSCIQIMREKLKECCHLAYYFQPFNDHWHIPLLSEEAKRYNHESFHHFCSDYSSFEFPSLPVIDGEVKHCSYSELEKITDFKTENFIQTTHSGRLFRGTITKGSEKRPVIVKTWDFLLLRDHLCSIRPLKFCDEIELYETASAHPYLIKLSTYCCERRLAAVYDEEFIADLSDVLLDDAFGWDYRIRVATQLADLLAWLHERRIAVGSITASCIIINAAEFEPLVVFSTFCFFKISEDSSRVTTLFWLAGNEY
ncbi:hypothetical protein A4A49_12442 [Nicotiana attenuata]|uniref:Protein kinase domain-containing protein n=1 Tax=Nicotiana attenuata TaxID=49451 RepID=A0A1J6IQ27_NICAT|nr:hypothetical protein A4A49_12442 [Nicotiana attenuata]